MSPDSHFEASLLAGGFGAVAGVDEAGRGCIAGPVYAAAVILDRKRIPSGLNDSKRLTAAARNRLHREIFKAASVSVGTASCTEINSLNILRASLLAMRRAIEGLEPRPDFALVDGDRVPDDLPCHAWPVIGGDGKSCSIAAASIIAKVERDRHMDELNGQHPEFGWSRNRGYGTREHLEALRLHGPTAHHRSEYRPVREALDAMRPQ